MIGGLQAVWATKLAESTRIHDWRSVPVALLVWATAGCTWSCGKNQEITEFLWQYRYAVFGVCATGILVGVFLFCLTKGEQAGIILLLIFLTFCTSASHLFIRVKDPLHVIATSQKQITLTIMLDKPAVHSKKRGYDCSIQAHSVYVTAALPYKAMQAGKNHSNTMALEQVKYTQTRDNHSQNNHPQTIQTQTKLARQRYVSFNQAHNSQKTEQNWKKSNIALLVYAKAKQCSKLLWGNTVTLTANLAEHPYKPYEYLATVEPNSRIITQSNSNPLRQVIRKQYERFFAQTAARGSDAATVLLPSLTVGLMGTDLWYNNQTATMPPKNYTTMLTRIFENVGIMHIMAVSGGHFALVASFILAICHLLLLHKYVCAALLIMFQSALAYAMVPSDSVIRALVMAVIAAGAYTLGRPYHSLSALSWCVCGVCIICPWLALSVGFILSCVSSFGIIVATRPLQQLYAYFVPTPLASAIAVCHAAQVLSIPVQILIQPQLSFVSLPVNLLVAPVIGLITVLGLISWCLCGVVPFITHWLICLADYMLQMLVYMLQPIGQLPLSTMPWLQGIAGAMLAFVVQILHILLLCIAVRMIRKLSGSVEGGGKPIAWHEYSVSQLRVNWE